MIFGVLLVLTLISREWIEVVFDVDPDHGDGSQERLIVAISGMLAVVFAFGARYEWRRLACRSPRAPTRAAHPPFIAANADLVELPLRVR